MKPIFMWVSRLPCTCMEVGIALDCTEYLLLGVQIYNASTMSSEPVATVRLPGRVPVGLHGTYITSEEFKSQTEDLQETY